MKEIADPRWLYAKGLLFLLTGLLAAALLILQNPTLQSAALLVLTIWCFARAYYFAFYVVTHYVDPRYKFSGLGSFAVYLYKTRSQKSEDNSP